MKVSIIVPVHNVEKYLPEALESVIKQTYTDWELILVENRSRDRSYEVCLSYAEKYPDISRKKRQVFRMPETEECRKQRENI